MPTLAVFSMSDEYVPPTIDRVRLARRLVWALGYRCEFSWDSAPPNQSGKGGGFFSSRRPAAKKTQVPDVEGLHLDGASHNLSRPASGEAVRQFVQKCGSLLKRVAAR